MPAALPPSLPFNAGDVLCCLHALAEAGQCSICTANACRTCLRCRDASLASNLRGMGLVLVAQPVLVPCQVSCMHKLSLPELSLL